MPRIRKLMKSRKEPKTDRGKASRWLFGDGRRKR